MLHSAAGRAGVGRSHRMNPMRGEYKVPGGKLVAVDVEVADGRIARAAVSGDFFLEPDEALDAINAALVGMPQGATVAQLTGIVQSVLGADVTMVGFTPDSDRHPLGGPHIRDRARGPGVPGDAHGAGPGALGGRRGGRAPSDAADLGVGRARGGDRLVPVAV